MAIIRQEINLLDHATTGATDDLELAKLDTTQYNGTVLYYFEIVASIASGSENVTLRRQGTTTDDATIAVTGSTVPILFRSAAFTGGNFTYMVHCASTIAVVKSARIIVIQNATTLTNTETQIEIGNYNTSRTAETATILTNPKYWKYVAANWDGTKTFYAEAVYATALSNMDTMAVYLYESAAIDAPSWSLNATIFSGTPGVTTPLRSSVAFTPVDGRWYTIFSLNGSMDNHNIYRAGVVVRQSPSTTTSNQSQLNFSDGFEDGVWGDSSAGINEKQAQKFVPNVTGYINQLDLKLSKFGSPTDNLLISIGETQDGTVLWQTTLVSSSVTGISSSPSLHTFLVSPSVSVTSGNTYYIQTRRSGARDTNNNICHSVYNSGYTYVRSTRDNGAWVDVADKYWYFNIFTATTAPTKLEPQYLLANTLFAAGTALQTFLTKWDSTEWDDGAGSIAYIGQAEAANGSTSDVLIQEADAGSTVATINNIDNAGQAAATMPTSQNLDCLANANAGDVAAVRILVAYVFAASGGGTVYGQTCTAQITIADVIVRGPEKLTSEILSIADLVFRFPQRIISNAVVLADTAPKSTSRTLPAEILTLADILTSIKITIKEFLEMIFLSDVAVKATQTIKTEMVAISDAAIKATSRIFAETLALADKIIKQPARILTEILVLTETITRSATRTVSDVVTLADTAIKNMARTLASESLALADIIAKAPGKVLAETLTVSDSIVRTAARILTETISLIDSAAKATSRALADAIALSDILTAIKITLKQLVEIIAVNDTITRSIGAVRTDILTLTDTATRTISRAVVDAFSLLDNAAKATSRALTEQITLGDIFSGIKVTAKTLIEAITLNDTISKTTGRISAEVLALADTIKRNTSRAFQDALSLTDNAFKSIARILATETMNLADTLARATTRVLAQSISITDAAVKQTSRTFSDIVTLGDSVVRAIGKTVIEAISLIDTAIAHIVGGGASYFLTLADRITTSDSITRAISKVATETITLVDSIGRGIVMVLERLILYLFGRAKSVSLPQRNAAAYLPVRAVDAFQEARSVVLYKNKSVLT